MDEVITKYYRQLLRDEFPNSGEMETPTVFVEAVGERLINCGNTGNYMQLFLRVIDLRISEIKYLCSCEPVANVAVEIMCNLVKGKTLTELLTLQEEPFIKTLGSQDETFRKKTQGLLALLKEGIRLYLEQNNSQNYEIKIKDTDGEKLSWDGTSST